MIFWRNTIPAWGAGISAVYSLHEILTGMKMNFKKYCRLDFGKYVEVHDRPTPTNSLKSHTKLCVALGPICNLQGTFKFMDIITCMKLKKRSWTCIPMPDSAIGKITLQAEKEKRDGSWRVRNRNNEEFDFDEGLEDTTALTCIEPDAHPNIPAELSGVELEREHVTDALDATDQDTDPLAATRAIENAEFYIRM